MPKRPCARPGCASLVVSGYCDRCRPTSPAALAAARHEAERQSAAKRGYGRAWQRARIGYLAKHPACDGVIRVQDAGAIVVLASRHPGQYRATSEVDHIIPHKGDRTLFWDSANNWQALCKSCHSWKTARDGAFVPRLDGGRTIEGAFDVVRIPPGVGGSK